MPEGVLRAGLDGDSGFKEGWICISNGGIFFLNFLQYSIAFCIDRIAG